MAIWQPTEGSSPKFGAELGEVWARGVGSNVLSCTPRPASKLERRQFQSWTTPGPWAQRWKHLTNAQRASWEAYAADHELYRLTGRPQIVTGQVHFETYWRQVKLFQGSNPSAPWDPPSPPAWQAGHQPFEPFTDEAEGMAFICRTTRANPIDFFIAAQPPLLGRRKLTRATLVPLGTFTLPAGAPGQVWTDPADAAAALFGAAAFESQRQQWFMPWELSNGAPLPVLDPCNTPPPQPPSDTVTITGVWPGGFTLAYGATWNEEGQAYLHGDGQLAYTQRQLENGQPVWVGYIRTAFGADPTYVGGGVLYSNDPRGTYQDSGDMTFTVS